MGVGLACRAAMSWDVAGCAEEPGTFMFGEEISILQETETARGYNAASPQTQM